MIAIVNQEEFKIKEKTLAAIHSLGIGVDRKKYWVFPIIRLGIPIDGYTTWNNMTMEAGMKGITNLMVIK